MRTRPDAAGQRTPVEHPASHQARQGYEFPAQQADSEPFAVVHQLSRSRFCHPNSSCRLPDTPDNCELSSRLSDLVLAKHAMTLSNLREGIPRRSFSTTDPPEFCQSIQCGLCLTGCSAGSTRRMTVSGHQMTLSAGCSVPVRPHSQAVAAEGVFVRPR